MVGASSKSKALLVFILLVDLAAPLRPQQPDRNPLNRSGEVTVDGRPTPYLIRHLPVNAFPQLPSSIQDTLNRRGCLIPQTYEAHQPENVINASLEQRGSSDWAVLCSVDGTVSLLVFFGSGGGPMVLATAQETDRLQAHGAANLLGFNWAIDPASAETIRAAQAEMSHPLPLLDHDGIADSVIDQNTIYRVFVNKVWTVVETQN